MKHLGNHRKSLTYYWISSNTFRFKNLDIFKEKKYLYTCTYQNLKISIEFFFFLRKHAKNTFSEKQKKRFTHTLVALFIYEMKGCVLWV